MRKRKFAITYGNERCAISVAYTIDFAIRFIPSTLEYYVDLFLLRLTQ